MNRPLRCALSTGVLCALAACTKGEPASIRGDNAADAAAQTQKASAAASAPALPVAAGATFNAAFPADGTDGYKRVFTQEQNGYAEAKLQKDGKEVAMLSVTDTNGIADAKAKFAGATEKLGEWPMTIVGKHQTTILVRDRYQVKASSQTLDHDARKKLLEKFDLKRLGAADAG